MQRTNTIPGKFPSAIGLHISTGGLLFRSLPLGVFENRGFLHEGNESQAAHEWPQWLRDNDAFRGLKVLDNAANCSLGGGQSAVEHVHVPERRVREMKRRQKVEKNMTEMQ